MQLDDAVTRIFRAAIDAQNPHGQSVTQQQRGRRAFTSSYSRKNPA